MPRQMERRFSVECPARIVFELAQQALINIGLRIKEVNEVSREIRATKGLSIWSYGHSVIVWMETDGQSASTRTALTVSSGVRFPQLVDYGTNRKLIQQFENQLEHLIATAAWTADAELASRIPDV